MIGFDISILTEFILVDVVRTTYDNDLVYGDGLDRFNE